MDIYLIAGLYPADAVKVMALDGINKSDAASIIRLAIERGQLRFGRRFRLMVST